LISIDLGCGISKKKGAIGLDNMRLKGVDIICDLNHGLPLKDDSIDAVYTSHFLEHTVNFVAVMEEIYRVSRHDAEIEIIAPYWHSNLAVQDPTHRHFFTEDTFYYFTRDQKTRKPRNSDYGFHCDFRVKEVRLVYANFFLWLRFIPFGKYHPGQVFGNVVRELKVSLKVNKKSNVC
jgi:SAM-dependent methyltransferase